MVTKWRKFSRQSLIKKITCVVIIAALMAGSLVIANWIVWERDFYRTEDADIRQEYGNNHYNGYYSGYYSGYGTLTEEQYAFDHLQNYINIARNIALLQSENYISSEDYFMNFELDSSTGEWIGKNSAYYDYAIEEEYEVVEKYDDYIGFATISETEVSDGAVKSERVPLEQKQAALISLGNQLHYLENSGLDYYIKTGNNVYTSNPDKKKPKNKYYLTVDNHILTNSENLLNRASGPQEEFLLQSSKDSIYLGTDAKKFETYAAGNQKYGQEKRKFVAMILAIGGIGFLAVLNLLVGAGRIEEDQGQNIHLGAYDQMYLDVSAALGVFILFMTMLGIQYALFDFFEKVNNVIYIGSVAMALLPGLYAVRWFSSFATHFKNGKWWRHTLIYKCCNWLFLKGKEAWNNLGELKTIYWLILSLVVLGILGVLTLAMPPFLILDGLVAIAFVMYMYYSIDKASKAAEDIESGTLQRPIKGLGGSFQPLARSLENIATGVDTAVSQRMKSERLKTDLITNVSHDIRTPLTSLITYTDLLESKGLDHPEAQKYLDVLIQKSQRLKDLTDDLFEATKAASGDIPINIENIDLVQLFHQSLGEMEDKRKSSKLDFHLNIPEHAYVRGDGRLLSRVLQNLFSNIFKYSQPNSRVYIDFEENKDTFQLVMKNISQYPLNIPAEQLSERFLRGDESRSSEGSGLGLSIVQSFVQAQGGKVDISIDGDLFKTVITLDKTEEP